MLTLFDLARSLTATMGVQDATDLIAKHLRRLIPSSTCAFFIYDEEADELVAAQTSGEHASLIKGLRIAIGQRLSGWVAANRQTIRNSDPVLDLGESARAMTPRPRSCLSTPLLAGSQLVGVLSLYSSNKDAYSEEHERIAEAVARQVSPVIAEAHAGEERRVRSLKDHATGLPNLRYLKEFVQTQLAFAGVDQPVSVVVVRSVLRTGEPIPVTTEQMVDAVRRALRAADLLFSTGPDELTAVLVNTDRRVAQDVALKIRDTIASLTREGLPLVPLVGIASAPLEASTPDDLLSLARQISHGPDVGPPEAIH
jgi:signal transduction protein with GAF and PtsI domain